MLTFAIGYIHRSVGTLRAILSKNHEFANGCASKFVSLGDYIDRGPDSATVVQTIMDMQVANPEGVIAICGNQEDMLLNVQKRDAVADDW